MKTEDEALYALTRACKRYATVVGVFESRTKRVVHEEVEKHVRATEYKPRDMAAAIQARLQEVEDDLDEAERELRECAIAWANAPRDAGGP